MMVIISAIKTIRNHWKKSVLIAGLSYWGGSYLLYRLKCYNLMKAYCEEARKYGHTPLAPTAQPRHVTVILNPVANNKKGKALYEKYAEPLFFLAGIRVSLILTEREGQAKDLMEIMDNTDAVVIAGGNGLVHEAVTGLMRRPDQDSAVHRFPIGLIPIGKRNTIAKRLGNLKNKTQTEAELYAESAMAVVRETMKRVDVMKIEGLKGKPVYALEGLHFGLIRDSLAEVDKYWYLGSKMKPVLALLAQSWQSQPAIPKLTLSYSLPCSGCSKCYQKFQSAHLNVDHSPSRRWWHVFIRRPNNIPQKIEPDYQNIINEECGKRNDIEMDSLADLRIRNTNQCKLEINALQNKTSKSQFVTLGCKYYADEPFEQRDFPSLTTIEAGDVKLGLGNIEANNDSEDNTNDIDWFGIDTEQYEAQSLEVVLLAEKLKMYSAN